MRSLKALISILFLSVMAFSQAPQDKLRKLGDLFFAGYNGRNYASIEDQFNDQMRSTVPLNDLKGFLDMCQRNLGTFVTLGPPRFSSQLTAVFPADFQKAKIELTISIDDRGKISGLMLDPPKPDKQPNTSRNKTEVRLPFQGEWLIFWGGDTAAQNYHQDYATQRFAFDILKADVGGKTHKGTGTRNEDYYAFGQEIVADADGIVVNVVTGVRDNVPGVMNPLMAVGNFVMIRHANGEVSVFCHLKFESTRVKAGQQVKRGDVIGLCGNTGNSSEPHLHYQVQGTDLFEDENSMKVFFEKIMVNRDGKAEEKTEFSPIKGDIVSQN